MCRRLRKNSIDEQQEFLGKVCRMDKTFDTSIYYKAEQCFPPPIKNTAWLQTKDTEKVEKDYEIVYVDVACKHGCTLTQGYWKTHSEKGPAPYDDTWAQLPDGAKTWFFNTGKTWHQMFWTPPAGGNACISLAHQWMRAWFNNKAGASLAAVRQEFDEAKAMFEDPKFELDKCPKKARKLAEKLDKYNNGELEPDHCDE